MSLGGGGGREELEELSQQIEALEEQESELEQQVEALEREKREIDEAIEGIESLETGDTVQVPMGNHAYVRAEIESIEEIIVGIGGEYATEQPPEEAIDTLEGNKDDIDEQIEEIQSRLSELQAEQERLQQEAQQAQQQLLQQQAGGPGGQPDADSDE